MLTGKQSARFNIAQVYHLIIFQLFSTNANTF